jgi:L-ascorbate metabolism protein UlaG (beta-lactamase superfamily)
MELQFLGHSTCVLDVDGVRLVTDPVLRRTLLHLRRLAPRQKTPRDVDVVLISHAHHDHLDLPSLLHLGRQTHVVVPRGVGRLLHRRGFRNITEVDPGDETTVGAVRVRATPAAHAGGRPPFARDARALGYVVEGSVKTYFAGDTDLFPEMTTLARELDLALLPVWGWGLKLGSGLHLDPARAAEAVERLQPRVAVPIHWGTFLPAHRGFRRLPPSFRDPPHAFAAAVLARTPDVEVRILKPGESLTLLDQQS